ncbi:MAG: heparinase II/III-family protein, partial [Kiritimatiellaeota bacterium]|nr:heparinase II/III-family protein [Kiritimatiellota bacterium]
SHYMELGGADLHALCREFKKSPDLPLHFWEPSLDHAMARTSWEPDAISFFFGCHSPVCNGHAHIGLLSFDLFGLGKILIADPGTFCYRQDDDRRYFKSTAAHSTLMIDGKDQFPYIDSWAFGPQKEGRMTRVWEGENFLAAQGFHKNHEPATHRRLLAIVDKKYVVVWDVVEDILPGGRVDILFNVDATDCRVDGSSVLADCHGVNLLIKTVDGLAVELQPGRISEAKDTARPCTRVFLRDAPAQTRVKNYFTLLYPCRGEPPRVSAITLDAATARVEICGVPCVFAWDGEDFSVSHQNKESSCVIPGTLLMAR